MASLAGTVGGQNDALRLEEVKLWTARNYNASREWLQNYFVPSKNIFFIWGLILGHSIVEYATVSTLMVYLANVIGQHLLIATITINVCDGLSAVLAFIITFVADAITTRFNAIVFSTGAYIMGLILLWITSFSSNEFSICNVALSLIAVGKSGRGSVLRAFFEYQLKKENSDIETVGEHQTTQQQQRDIGVSIWWHSAWISGYVMALFGIGRTNSPEYFKISVPLMSAVFILFYSGLWCYHKENPHRRSIGDIFSDLKVTSRKLYLWATFFPIGLVLATGYTLFIVQTTNMNIHVGGNFAVPIFFLFVLKSFISNIVVFLFWCRGTTGKRIMVLRIGTGMVCAVMCCVAARQVELQRLHIIKKESLLQDLTKMSSMSVLWLIPQYSLLGLMEGLAGDGLITHIRGRVPRTERSFAEPFSELMLCTGKFSSIFFVLLCNSWFGQRINTSHLDRYFLMLAIMCSLFFCFYLFWWWNYENPEANAEYQQLVTSQAMLGTGKLEGEDVPEIKEPVEEILQLAQDAVKKDEDKNTTGVADIN